MFVFSGTRPEVSCGFVHTRSVPGLYSPFKAAGVLGPCCSTDAFSCNMTSLRWLINHYQLQNDNLSVLQTNNLFVN